VTIRIDMRQVALVIARAVDLVGVDDVRHGRRVAVLAAACAKRLGWDAGEQSLLFDAGLLHDCGVSSTRVRRTLGGGLDWDGAHEHAERGHHLLAAFPPLAHLAPIVLHHHTRWDRSQELEPRLRLRANLLFLADRVDMSAAPHYAEDSLLLHALEVRDLIDRHRGLHFAPELVEAFLAASLAESFWLALHPDFIEQEVAAMTPCGEGRPIGLGELRQLGLLIARIIDAKSRFTTDHSLGVARLAVRLAQGFGIGGERLERVEVAGLLHDIGKLQIPDDVLESRDPLSPTGRAVMRKHSFATWQILRRIGGLEEIAHWASRHHESLDGDGYPFRFLAGDLSLEARIIKVADVYQALAQDRPYRGPMAAPDILAVLREMQASQAVDGRIVDLVAEHLDECHAAAVGAGEPAVTP
jgi:putative nucleotidyltransferase with HDIG domain